VGFVTRPHAARTLSVTILDVGQGDAILIETPAGHDILVDGGPGPGVVRALGSALPWHDRSIDIVVVTHPQADHATGLLEVFDRYYVRRVISGPLEGESLVTRGIVDAARREGAAQDVVVANRTIDLGDGITLDVLVPHSPAAPATNANDNALVLRIQWRDVSFLLASDIEAPAERALLASGVPLGSTVLKVAHHGSATSSTRAFLDVVQPRTSPSFPPERTIASDTRIRTSPPGSRRTEPCIPPPATARSNCAQMVRACGSRPAAKARRRLCDAAPQAPEHEGQRERAEPQDRPECSGQ
jgi:beta-lactamase superfamily II metal-dependent hydrolase